MIPSSSPVNPETRLVLFTPVRDEEQYIGAMMQSILAQTIRPARWIIVDDGSIDSTCEIIARYQQGHDFIELLRLPRRDRRRPGGEGAIDCALHGLCLEDFDFLARFDADLCFESNYIAGILGEFEKDPSLGIAGGGLFVEKDGTLQPEKAPAYHVRGALKMYRRECFEQIGRLATCMGWDTIDEVSAWTKGWATKSFFQYRVIHRRPTGEGLPTRRIYWKRGEGEYFTWSDPLFVMAKAFKIARDSRGVTAPLSFLAGFAACYFSRPGRLRHAVFVVARRKQQRARMATAEKKLLLRLFQIPLRS